MGGWFFKKVGYKICKRLVFQLKEVALAEG